MFAKVKSLGLIGLNAYVITVEADISNGLPRFDIVGLPDVAVSESKNRVRSAIIENHFRYSGQRITVNLAPADVKKEGPIYDLPILIAMLIASKQLFCETEGKAFIGELSLDGVVRKINGVLPMVISARDNGLKEVYVPLDNIEEAAVVDGIDIYPVKNVSQLCDHLAGREKIKPYRGKPVILRDEFNFYDFSDVKGQFLPKRALEIAAAGGHNILLIGPPGSGKSMLAKRIPGILPDMTFEESLETTKIYSIAGQIPSGVSLITTRPFRSPHHTVSTAGLSGGGRIPHPGELSLAHNGVLFLDELPEFSKQAMETLRQPLEDGVITISRVAGSLTYPCDIMFVASANPCPCGYFGSRTRKCTCPPGAAQKYMAKLSGPMLDRIDLHVEVPEVDFKKLSDDTKGETSAVIKERVNKARKIQQERFKGTPVKCNGKMTASMTRQYCKLNDECKAFFEECFDKLNLSARAYDKILRVARTIADLDGNENISLKDLKEAIQYRSLDRKYWQR